MGREKADGSGPVKHRKTRLRGPQAKPRTRASGAAKLLSDFTGPGSLPRPIHEETQRLWRRLWSYASLHQSALLRLQGEDEPQPVSALELAGHGDGMDQISESMDRD